MLNTKSKAAGWNLIKRVTIPYLSIISGSGNDNEILDKLSSNRTNSSLECFLLISLYSSL